MIVISLYPLSTDSSACTLQSYTRKVRTLEGGTVKVMAKSRGHGPITMATYDGNARSEGQVSWFYACPVPACLLLLFVVFLFFLFLLLLLLLLVFQQLV